jgi:hypothetical protein
MNAARKGGFFVVRLLANWWNVVPTAKRTLPPSPYILTTPEA